MRTDLLIARFPTTLIWSGEMPLAIATALRQLADIVLRDLAALHQGDEDFWATVHDQLARERGVLALDRGTDSTQRCARFLLQPFDLWNDHHRSADYYVKSRLSLIELVLRTLEARVATEEASTGTPAPAWRRWPRRPMRPVGAVLLSERPSMKSMRGVAPPACRWRIVADEIDATGTSARRVSDYA